MERGHVYQGVTFCKEWTVDEVQQKIRSLLSNILDEHDLFEIAASVHTKIVKPTLDRGQLFDGILLHQLFKQKTMYIVPDRDLFQTTGNLKDEETADSYDYEDLELIPPKCKRMHINMLTESDSLAHEQPLASDELPPAFNANDAVLSSQFANLRSYLDHIKPPLIDRDFSFVNRIVVRRRKLWDDTMEKMKLFYNIYESNPL